MSRCGKRRYRTDLDAKLALARTEAAAVRHRKHPKTVTRDELRVYLCDRCRGWHLTSSP